MERTDRLKKLVFLIGFPRSGTTWVSNLINSHPDTVYRHETIGRDYPALGEALFKRLKSDHGLSDSDHARAVETFLKARVLTDRPPFFKKRFHPVKSPALQKLLWMLVRLMPFMAPIYGWLYTPRRRSDLVLVIKETRSSVNLDSIIEGARADALLILVRHPYGVIASHLRGGETGDMGLSSREYRQQWYRHHLKADYLVRSGLDESHILDCPEAEFLAICWRIQNEDYLGMHRAHPNSKLIVYEQFLEDTPTQTAGLLEHLGLTTNEQVEAFIDASSSNEAPGNIMNKDASSQFYSVYRGKDFDPNRWAQVLSDSDRALIDHHTKELTESLGLGLLTRPRTPPGPTEKPPVLGEQGV